MATMKIIRLDTLIEYIRQLCEDDEIRCCECQVSAMCEKPEYLCLKKDEFKKAIIDRFSTDVEVVDNEDD